LSGDGKDSDKLANDLNHSDEKMEDINRIITASLSTSAYPSVADRYLAMLESEDIDALRDLVHNGPHKKYINCSNIRWHYTALHLATFYNDTELIEKLLQDGADPRLQDKNGYTPLHHASLSGNGSIISTLMDHGANDRIPNNTGELALHLAARSGNVDALDIMIELSSDMVDINAPGALGRTALHEAALTGNMSAVQLLLENGADPNVLDVFDRSPSQAAYDHNHTEVATYLMAITKDTQAA
jgi:ankyrin repeat protein